LAQRGKFETWREFWPVFVPSLTAMIGFWATLSLNMPDFTRFGKSQREQAIGQVVALPTTMTIFAAMGVIITSASAIIFGKAIWDPVELVGKFTQPAVVAISMFTVVVATLSVNIAANVVSPANDFANAFPRFITFSRGGLLAGVIGILMQPWRLLADPSGYIYDWLLGYSGGLGSIAGVLIADYWIVRKSNLVVEDLYREDGIYERWRWSGIMATILGCTAAWIGLAVPALRILYDYAWFVGFAVSFGSYLVLSKPSVVLKPVVGIIVLCGVMSGVLSAQSTKTEDLAAGKVLVMERDAPDPNFAETVIILIHYGPDGVVGLTLNRAASIPVSRLNEFKGTANRSDPVYAGGPVELDAVTALVRTTNAPSGSIRVAADLYAVQTKRGLEAALKTSKGPDDLRIYLGYCGWTFRQLQNEVKLGSWYIFDRGELFAFDSTPSTLWKRLIDRTGLHVAFSAH
jgi:putative AlgH/UPF0301 family transcriptional regulator